MIVVSFELRQIYHIKNLYSNLKFCSCHFNNILQLIDPVTVKNQAVETESLIQEAQLPLSRIFL